MRELAPLARGSQEAVFTQPRDNVIAHIYRGVASEEQISRGANGIIKVEASGKEGGKEVLVSNRKRRQQIGPIPN